MATSLAGRSSSVASIVPAVYTTTQNGASADLRSYNSNAIVVVTGVYGGTAPAAKVKVQESVDNSVWTDVADSDLEGITGNASGVTISASSLLTVGYIGSRRYIRVILSSVTGTTPSIPASVVIGRFGPKSTSYLA